LGAKSLDALALDLFPAPAERAAQMARAFDEALERDRTARLAIQTIQASREACPANQRGSGWMLAGFELSRQNEARLVLGARLASHLCRQAASSGAISTQSAEFWPLLQSACSKRHSLFADLAHETISEHPERIVDWAIAPSLPNASLPRSALSAQAGAAAWLAMATRSKRRGYANKHILLARAHPCPEMEERCKSLCPEPVAAQIERAEIDAALSEHAREQGAFDPEPAVRPKPRL
jgi:hypothetical protein